MPSASVGGRCWPGDSLWTLLREAAAVSGAEGSVSRRPHLNLRRSERAGKVLQVRSLMCEPT